jgi:class 3 adenylate cyclase/predicted ATPase
VDVGAWLHGLGFGQYEQAFRDNDVDAQVLPGLTVDDLKEIGVASVGHRRLMLQAIAALSVAPAGPATAAVEAVVAPATHAPSQAERRQLTIMFVDLVGSTELSRRLDPEEMGEVIRAYQNVVAGEVTRFEGYIAKYMGDGVLAYFGWPAAHENAAERAVRAGLATAEAVGRLATPAAEPLAGRVGIATGFVVVGDLVGETEARERAVVGETPNLAARLQQVAEPGAVVVAEATRRLLGDLFEFEDLELRALRGFTEPVRSWRALGEGRAEGRFEALHGSQLTPFVGRNQELDLLLERWKRARVGVGQVVLLCGEPGIGKSRLVGTLRDRLAGEPHTDLSYFCSPHHRDSPLHPISAQLERAAGMTRHDTADEKLVKLETLLTQGSRDVQAEAPLFATLLAIPASDRCPAPALSPQALKERTLAALLAQLEGLADRRPTLLLFEDAHWIDPTSLELLDRIVEGAHQLAVLLLITFRPEFAPLWADAPHLTRMALARLGHQQGAVMVHRLAGGKEMPEEVLSQLVARTDGIPLFVEELTKSVLESGLLRDVGDRYELTGPLPPLAIPSSLHDSLMARLDRLAATKEVAQIGAVIGREFPHDLLAAAASLPEADLRRALIQLIDAELVSRHGTPPEATYSFKHALVRDAAYESLLKSRRRQLHARVARALEEGFLEVLAAEPEVVARHYTAAELAAEAVPYWLRAGQQALQRSALREAIAQLTQGLDLLTRLPAGSDRDRKEADLRLALGNAIGAAQGGSAPEALQAYARVAELCEQSGDTSHLVAALYGLITFHFSRADFATALGLAEHALAAADRGNDVHAQLAGHSMVGLISLALGRLHAARAHLEHASALLDPARRRPLLEIFGIDLRVRSLVYLSWTLFALGYPSRARDLSRLAIVEAKDLAHPLTLGMTLDRTTSVAEFCRDIATVAARAEALAALGREQGFLVYVTKSDFDRGWVMVEEGCITDGIALMRAALSSLEASHEEEFMPHSLGLLAAALAKGQEVPEAWSVARDALARVKRTGERLFEADLHCLEGNLLLALSKRDQAEGCFYRAMEVAREQGARWWELRATTSLARLWVGQGKHREAHDLLAPICGWFTEGFETPDLQDARTLLDELR